MKNLRIFKVEDRRAETLIPLIIDNLHPNTILISDCWTSYNKIWGYPEYEHLTTNHSVNFVDPDDSRIHSKKLKAVRNMLKYNLNHRTEDPVNFWKAICLNIPL